MKPGLLIYNLKAGRGTFPPITKLQEALPEARAIDVCEVTPAILRESQWVAVAGGDGTVESIAGDLLDTDIPLGIIPAGTFNNFARSLNLPLDPMKACEVIRRGFHRPADVGFASYLLDMSMRRGTIFRSSLTLNFLINSAARPKLSLTSFESISAMLS